MGNCVQKADGPYVQIKNTVTKPGRAQHSAVVQTDEG